MTDHLIIDGVIRQNGRCSPSMIRTWCIFLRHRATISSYSFLIWSSTACHSKKCFSSRTDRQSSLTPYIWRHSVSQLDMLKTPKWRYRNILWTLPIVIRWCCPRPAICWLDSSVRTEWSPPSDAFTEYETWRSGGGMERAQDLDEQQWFVGGMDVGHQVPHHRIRIVWWFQKRQT